MDKIRLVQEIGSVVCDECGPEADCGLEPENCSRIADALSILKHYQTEERDGKQDA